MILQGNEAAEALYHLLTPAGEGGPVVLWHAGKRYGGFSSEEHALFVARQQGWDVAVIEVAPAADRREVS